MYYCQAAIRVLMRILLCLVILTSGFLPVQAQMLEQIIGPEQHIPSQRELAASWIRHPDAGFNAHEVILFRKNFQLERVPYRFVVHISADNQYRLFVNGTYAAKGPARSDLHHWYYETLDLAPLLKAGENTLAVEVVNFGPKRGWSQFSHMTSLFVMGRGPSESPVNTVPGSWRCMRNEAHYPLIVEWIGRREVAFGLYVANPTDSITGRRYPWGWHLPEYDHRGWLSAARANNAGTRNTQYAGGIVHSGGKLLEPRPIRMIRERQEPLGKVVRVSGVSWQEGYLVGERSLEIPARRRVSLWIDRGHMTIGYPELSVSGGEGSTIEARYAETLFNEDRMSKGNRNDFKDKVFVGIRDVFMPDGGPMRVFRPTWLRSFRFIELNVTTGEEPLVMHGYHNQYSAYDLELKASFRTDRESLDRLMEPGWRTVSLCAQDILMSDAYYEQMQYVGDSKVHNLALLFLSGNDDLVRNQLRQTDWSRIPEGLTIACYPNAFHLVIPFYSLLWIDMIHDYMMWSGDRDFVRSFEPGIAAVLDWFQRRLLPDGLLGPLEWWNYVDWSPGFPNGVPPGIVDGRSALFSLQYALTLDRAADILDFTGRQDDARHYRAQASGLRGAVRSQCYDEGRGLFADTPDKQHFSQHTNILAVLSGCSEGEEAQRIMMQAPGDSSLHQVALFFRYYLLEALHRAGLADRLEQELHPWQSMLGQGLTTFTEVPIEWASQRSDCHPWSAAPNIHFFTSICGIRPLAPGYSRVLVAPEPGSLNEIRASLPHPKGALEIDLHRQGRQEFRGSLRVPAGMEVTFRWKDQETSYGEGVHELRLK
jgi:alpha-L-rhamnosidase